MKKSGSISQRSPIFRRKLDQQYTSLMNLLISGSSTPANSIHGSLEKGKPQKQPNQFFLSNKSSKTKEEPNITFNSPISSFVEDVSADPSILKRLIDYTFLSDCLIEQIECQKKKLADLQQSKQKQQEIRELYLINQNNSSLAVTQIQIQKINFQLDQISRQENKIIADISHRRIQMKKKNDKLMRQFKQRKRIHEKAMKEMNENVLHHRAEINKNKRLLRDLDKKMEKYGEKEQKRRIMERRVEEKREQVEKKREGMIKLKKEQNQALKKYREVTMNKMGVEISLRNASEKKLKVFIKQIEQILNSGDQDKFCTFLEEKNYQSRNTSVSIYSIKSKNSDKTSPQEEDSFSQNERFSIEKELSSLEQQNPVLKNNKTLNVKTLDNYSEKVKEDIKNVKRTIKSYEESINGCNEKIEKIIRSEKEKQEFILSLQEKLKQIDEQLLLGTILQKGLKKSMSFKS